MAGFTIEEMKSLLVNKTLPDNIILPREFETRINLTGTQQPTANKPLSLAQMADTGLTEKQEGTTPIAPKTLTLAQMADVSAKEPMGLFEKLEANDFEEYTRAGGTELSKKDFLSLSAQEQANAIYQAKNCKQG